MNICRLDTELFTIWQTTLTVISLKLESTHDMPSLRKFVTGWMTIHGFKPPQP